MAYRAAPIIALLALWATACGGNETTMPLAEVGSGGAGGGVGTTGGAGPGGAGSGGMGPGGAGGAQPTAALVAEAGFVEIAERQVSVADVSANLFSISEQKRRPPKPTGN